MYTLANMQDSIKKGRSYQSPENGNRAKKNDSG